jgi:hypothetical protein
MSTTALLSSVHLTFSGRPGVVLSPESLLSIIYNIYHPFVNISLVHTVTTIIYWYTSVRVTSFYALWPPNLDHRASFLFGGPRDWKSCSSCYSITTQKDNDGRPIDANVGGSFCLYLSFFAVLTSPSLRGIKFSLSHIYPGMTLLIQSDWKGNMSAFQHLDFLPLPPDLWNWVFCSVCCDEWLLGIPSLHSCREKMQGFPAFHPVVWNVIKKLKKLRGL